jgi:hypothetical protein
MNKGKLIFARFLIIIISVFFIDGGKSFLLKGENVEIPVNQNYDFDLEIPHQHNFNDFSSEEKWIGTSKFEFYAIKNSPVNFLYKLAAESQDYSSLIWQPPKRA